MAFGQKKKVAEGPKVTQSNAAHMAATALAKMRLNRVRVAFRLHGTAPLLVHRWTQKAVIQFLGKASGNVQPRGNKDLTTEYEQSYWRNTEGVACIPARTIKRCIVEGAVATDGVATKAELGRALRVLGHTAPLMHKGKPARHVMDVQPARNDGGGIDIRSRARFDDWSCDVVLEFCPSILSVDKVVSAFAAAGEAIGIGDYRPDTKGEYGTFRIEALGEADVARIMKENALPEEQIEIPPDLLRAADRLIDENKASDKVRKAVAVTKHVNGEKRSSN